MDLTRARVEAENQRLMLLHCPTDVKFANSLAPYDSMSVDALSMLRRCSVFTMLFLDPERNGCLVGDEYIYSKSP